MHVASNAVVIAVFRWFCCLGGTLTIACLMAANLAGFVLGAGGLVDFLLELSTEPMYLAKILVTFFSAANLMFMLQP